MLKQLKPYNLITNPNPILRKISVPVELDKIDKKTIEIIDRMIVTMKKNKGVGIAAPQIGKNIRIVIISTKKENTPLINPKITYKSKETQVGEEGCLSVPKTFGDVERSNNIKVTYFDINKKEHNIEASGYLARVIQHEVDHLDGVLFVDKIKSQIPNNK